MTDYQREIITAVTGAVAAINKAAPVNLQSDDDVAAQAFFVQSVVMSAIGKQFSKSEDTYKKLGHSVTTEHYVIHYEEKAPQNRFNKDVFIAAVAEKFNIPKHKLIELAAESTKETAAPRSVSIALRDDI